MSRPPVPFRHAPELDAVGRLLAKGAGSMKTPSLGAESRARILSTLPVQAAAPNVAWSSWTKLAVIVVAGASVLGAISFARSTSSPSAGGGMVVAAPPATAIPAPTPSVPTEAHEPGAPPVFSVRDLPSAVPAPRARVVAEPAAASSVARAGDTADTLSREVALLDRARASSDPATSLAILAEHARTFPNGKLAPEREVFAIEALLRAGRTDEARARGDAFVKAQPESAHAARVKALLR